MGVLPPLFHSSSFRTSTNSRINVQEANVRRSLNKMLEVENQLATGYRVNLPSDDPLAASRAMGFRRQIEQNRQYLRNISLSRTELQVADESLGALNELVNRAREIYLSSQNAVTGQFRETAANEVDRLIREAVAIVNRKHQGRYLFGGSDGRQPPAQLVGQQVLFTGSDEAVAVTISLDETLQRNVTAGESFGGIGSEVLGRVDLDPLLSAATKIADLNRGEGAQLGFIRIDTANGLTSTIDLSSAETIGDVLNLINADGTLTAAVNAAGNGIDLTLAGDTISVSEVNNGSTAEQLGILQIGAAGTLAGSDLDPLLRLDTPLADLRAGAGIDLSGLTIRQGGATEPVSFAGAQTVEDLLNAINLAGIQVRAAINDAGDGIDLRSLLSGTTFSVEENGGSSAADLGLLIDFVDLPLDRLNRGIGIRSVSGNDFRITLKDGSTIDVDLGSAQSIQDILDLINNHPDNPGTLVASVPSGQQRLQLDDSSGGTDPLSVAPLEGSLAAQTLGILMSVPDPGTTLSGDDLAPAGHRVDSLFDVLVQLRGALLSEASGELDLVQSRLDSLQDRLIEARADVGVRVNRLDFTQSRLEGLEVSFRTLISEEREVDLAAAVSEFEKQRALLEASYQVTGRLLQLSLLEFLG